jgi:hypothetical protein
MHDALASVPLGRNLSGYSYRCWMRESFAHSGRLSFCLRKPFSKRGMKEVISDEHDV